jgi:hypothetical protein
MRFYLRKYQSHQKYSTIRPKKTVENEFKNDYALLQITRICLIRMRRDIPLSVVKNAPVPMKYGSFSVGAPPLID